MALLDDKKVQSYLDHVEAAQILSINVFFYIWPHTLVVSPYFDHVVDPTMQFVFQLSVHLPPRRFTIPYG